MTKENKLSARKEMSNKASSKISSNFFFSFTFKYFVIENRNVKRKEGGRGTDKEIEGRRQLAFL